MEVPLSWVWVAQVALLILFTALVVTTVLALYHRHRRIIVHVLTHETNKTWEQVKAQIVEKSPAPVQWRYTEVAKERGFED